MNRIVWTRRAVEDAHAIKSFIAQDFPTSATLVAQRILDAIEHLPKFPESGRIVSEYTDPIYRPCGNSFGRPIASSIVCGRTSCTSSPFIMPPAGFESRLNPGAAEGTGCFCGKRCLSLIISPMCKRPRMTNGARVRRRHDALTMGGYSQSDGRPFASSDHRNGARQPSRSR